MFAESGLLKNIIKYVKKNTDFHISNASSCKQFFVKILQKLYMKMSIAAEPDFQSLFDFQNHLKSTSAAMLIFIPNCFAFFNEKVLAC